MGSRWCWVGDQEIEDVDVLVVGRRRGWRFGHRAGHRVVIVIAVLLVIPPGVVRHILDVGRVRHVVGIRGAGVGCRLRLLVSVQGALVLLVLGDTALVGVSGRTAEGHDRALRTVWDR